MFCVECKPHTGSASSGSCISTESSSSESSCSLAHRSWLIAVREATISTELAGTGLLESIANVGSHLWIGTGKGQQEEKEEGRGEEREELRLMRERSKGVEDGNEEETEDDDARCRRLLRSPGSGCVDHTSLPSPFLTSSLPLFPSLLFFLLRAHFLPLPSTAWLLCFLRFVVSTFNQIH